MKKTGESVVRYGPFWHVVERKNGPRNEYVVVDTSPQFLHGKLPQMVYGPASRKDCEIWAHNTAMLYLTTKGVFAGGIEEWQ